MRNLNFDSSRWKLLNNVIVGLVSVVGITFHNYKVTDISIFQKMMIETMAPIQRGSTSLKEKVNYTFEHYINIINTSKENETLRKTIDKLNNNIFVLKEVKKENERLKQLMDFGREIPRKKVLAQVVSWDSSNEFKVLRINKGEAHGLKLMSPVITMTGLVGYVYRLSDNYADILTVLDQNNRVDGIVSSTRTHGIVEGHSGFTCQLKYVSRTETLEIGDEVVTAGLGEIYPKGIMIGRITKIDKENYGITQKIEVTPSVDFHRLEEVVILLEDTSSQELSVGRQTETGEQI